jgi:quercetin dioxygenase-like cupin family protein
MPVGRRRQRRGHDLAAPHRAEKLEFYRESPHNRSDRPVFSVFWKEQRMPRRIVVNPRVALLLLMIALFGLPTWHVTAQQPQQLPFTGNVAPLDTKDLSVVRITFEPGARTYWHSHAGGQIILAEEGRGRMQARGGTVQELRPNEPIYAPAGVPHWHGAAPDARLVQVTLNKGEVTWMGPVSDSEYGGRKQ